MLKIKKIALERVEILMRRAEEVFHSDRKLASRYVQLARKIAMRCTVRMPKRWKRRFCKRCGAFLVAGANCRVRTHEGRVVITCLECGGAARIPLAREKKARKNADKTEKRAEQPA